MTTTAEKIKVMQAFEDGTEIEWNTRAEWKPWVKGTKFQEPNWNWEIHAFRIKPADPEPLECWVAVGDDGGIIGASRSRIEVSGRVRAVHMREVTPQDEQDRKDAARYRKAKEISRNTTTLSVAIVSQWDRIIDKAMNED